jgi:hypothetical protein
LVVAAIPGDSASPCVRCPLRQVAHRNRLVILVRLLLFLALAAITVAVILYLFSRDRRYLRFIWQTVKFTILLVAVVLIFFAFERLVGPML